MKLESLPTVPPSGGFFSVRVTIQNHTLQAMEWKVDSISQRQEPTFLLRRSVQLRSSNTITVSANEEREVELMIPVVASYMRMSNPVTFYLKAAGFPQIKGIFPITTKFFSSPNSSFLSLHTAFDAGLPEKVLEKLPGLLANEKVPVLDPKLFSSDWRAYSGYFHLVVSAVTWLQLEPIQRDALKNWCALGGNLVQVGSPEINADNLLPEGPYGFGTIAVMSPEKLLTTFLPDLQTGREKQVSERAAWLGPKQDPKEKFLWIALLGVAFALLIGPINLFVLAPSQKRERLLWTTLLIAGGASLLFLGMIFVQQGIGGCGSRELLAFQLPEDGITALWQEQNSHTGFLKNNKFESADSVALFSIPFGSYLPQSSYSLKNGKKWTGDWFLPASWQTHIAAAILPSVRAIDLLPGERNKPPHFDGDPNIETLFYFRPDHSIWRWDAASNSGGMLLPTTQAEFEAWLDKMKFAPFLRRHLQRVCEHLLSYQMPEKTISLQPTAWKNGLIFSKYRSFPAIPTLPSIRWTDTSVLVITPL